MRKLLLFLVLVTILVALPLRVVHAKTITIAVIDTGVDKDLPHLCKMGHKSFVDTSPDPLQDDHGHGTHVAGIVVNNAGEGDYCIVAIKYYSDKNTGLQNLANLKKSIQYAINIKVDFINLSGGGPDSDPKERLLFKKALKNKIKIVAAAGNEHNDLDKVCNYFPACYDKRIVMVGNLLTPEEIGMSLPYPDLTLRSPSSNYGIRVTRWEVGTDVESTLPNGKRGKMSGTSQATAVATSELVKEALNKH
jgi:subtilisin family serine protease